MISDYGLAKIEGYEGWKKLIKEGPHAGCYAAYQDVYHGKLDKPTIGPGLTEDVFMGLVLTRDECSERFRKELERHEAAVDKAIKVPVTRNQREACISLSYNVGASAFTKSTVVKRLNKGDINGAAEAFKRFNRAGGGVVDGLVQRRASEAAWFLKPDEKPEEPSMPQTVTASKEPPKPTTVATAAATVSAVATAVAPTVAPQLPSVPAVPEAVTKSIESVHAWQGIGQELWTIKAWVISQPIMAGVLAIGVSGFYLWSKRAQKASAP